MVTINKINNVLCFGQNNSNKKQERLSQTPFLPETKNSKKEDPILKRDLKILYSLTAAITLGVGYLVLTKGKSKKQYNPFQNLESLTEESVAKYLEQLPSKQSKKFTDTIRQMNIHKIAKSHEIQKPSEVAFALENSFVAQQVASDKKNILPKMIVLQGQSISKQKQFTKELANGLRCKLVNFKYLQNPNKFVEKITQVATKRSQKPNSKPLFVFVENFAKLKKDLRLIQNTHLDAQLNLLVNDNNSHKMIFIADEKVADTFYYIKKFRIKSVTK